MLLTLRLVRLTSVAIANYYHYSQACVQCSVFNALFALILVERLPFSLQIESSPEDAASGTVLLTSPFIKQKKN